MKFHWKKVALFSGAGILGLLLLVIVLIASFDWNRTRPWINEKVSEATQRSFAINGDLSLSWEKPAYVQSGWRRWAPWPHFRAHDVQLGNPDWATTGPDMARVQRVDFTINPFALLGRTISIESLLLTEPNLMLEQNRKGDNNWTFPKKEKQSESKWEFVLQDLAIAQGNVRYVDPAKKADVTARITTLDDGSVTWKLGGQFNNEKLSGGGQAGALLMLQNTDVRYPVEALVKVGETTITAKGTITDPAHPSALDVELKILGASMADLFPLSGVLLPETPKFSTQGRVVGNLTRGSMRLRYEKFTGKVGASDIGGTLEYRQQEPRPMLVGEVVSNHLNFKDLGAIVGAGDDKKKDKDEVKQPPDRVLPVSPFKTERWDKMDVQVTFSGKEIISSDKFPIDNLHTKVKMDNGLLSLSPLDFGIAGGRLTTTLSINGRDKPAKAKMKVSARALKLAKLFPKAESMHASVGQINGDAELSAAGNSFAALLASSNGEVKSLISQGSISKFILEAAGLNVGSAVIAKVFGDKQVPLNCMATDFNVVDGLMESRFFIIDTEDATIRINGNINFDNEKLDLMINPDSKGIRIISLRSPLYVKGTFKNPDVGVDKRVLALKGGAAVALGTAAAPFAALLALINPGPAQDSPCAALLSEAKEKPKAPPPGKTKTTP